ncbi:MAG: hypothetical protein LBT39_08180 [Treponema sp.]|jgi:hypothetical protein|nr:hypothetical protein [Treponema sp.]
MRPVEHFLSQLDKASSNTVTPKDRSNVESRITTEFISLTAPVIGKDAAMDLCDACLDRLRSQSYHHPPYIKLGYVAAFLLGEFDDTMELDSDEWEDLRDTLEDAAGDMDMNTLTVLMGELLSRGRLG